MNPSNPQPGSGIDFDAMLSWALLIGLSMLGGIASFLQKMQSGHSRAWNFTEFLGELTASGLTGIVVANLCDSMALPAPMKYALVGIASHMGSRALFMLEGLFKSKFGLPAGAADPLTDKETDHAA